MSRIAVPGLVDLLRVEETGAIDALAADARMDRHYEPRGPLLNRLILGRVRRVLRLDGEPLPPVAPRGPLRPRDDQRATEARLAGLVAKGVAGPEVDALAAYVRGEAPKDAAGPLAQTAAGRLFVPTYAADTKSWAAARVLGAAPSNFNPLRLLGWALTNRVARARELLADKVGRDPTGVHATGVAIHNLVEAFQRMRETYSDREARERLSPEAAVAQAIMAPRQVLRQPTEAGTSSAGRFTPNTLVLLRLQTANAADPGYDTAFMTGQWSQCPAHDWVPALLAAVWRKAVGERG